MRIIHVFFFSFSFFNYQTNRTNRWAFSFLSSVGKKDICSTKCTHDEDWYSTNKNICCLTKKWDLLYRSWNSVYEVFVFCCTRCENVNADKVIRLHCSSRIQILELITFGSSLYFLDERLKLRLYKTLNLLRTSVLYKAPYFWNYEHKISFCALQVSRLSAQMILWRLILRPMFILPT
jgi:hypothetical protein